MHVFAISEANQWFRNAVEQEQLWHELGKCCILANIHFSCGFPGQSGRLTAQRT